VGFPSVKTRIAALEFFGGKVAIACNPLQILSFLTDFGFGLD
jgi:hypothetical protein